ncbi:NAD(P)-binding domain-containing protein [Christensenellaceae bacterium OttesenSCG-928-M15]|nr:NAD(P)-binding domain-containing protein [Christensenellaceae bacterium OttesenSCG-928-M15]
MKILIYGAGVQGSFLAHVLDNAGHEVKILARGQRAIQLKENGIVIRHYFQRKTTVDKIEVVEELKNDDLYDMIFVMMKYNDFQSVLPILSKNVSENIVLVGNNVTASEMQEYINEHSAAKKNVIFGFQISGGMRRGAEVVAIRFDAGEMKVGCLAGDVPDAITKAFESTKYKITLEKDIDAWLKTHAAMIPAMNFAAYIKDNNFKAVAKDNELLREAVETMGESYGILDALGYDLVPKAQANFFRNHEHMAFLFLKLYHRLPMANFVAGSIEEIFKMSDDLLALKRGLDLPTPNLESLMHKAHVKRDN